jgi:hypothetical protein
MKDDISMNQSIAHSRSKSTWTPYVQLPEREWKILAEIDTKLSTTLETLNKSLEMAKGEFPQIEDSFVSMCDRIQWLAEQTIESNKAFRIVKHQLQARTEALNDNIESLTTDIDKLRILVRNIRNDDFDSGNYLDIFSKLATRITSHLSETHNSKGEDINKFHELTWHAVNIIMKLDPAARNAYMDLWSTQSKEISGTLRTEKNHKKLAHEKDNELLETIWSTLDKIPESSTSREHTTKPRKPHQNNWMGKGKGHLRKWLFGKQYEYTQFHSYLFRPRVIYYHFPHIHDPFMKFWLSLTTQHYEIDKLLQLGVFHIALRRTAIQSSGLYVDGIIRYALKQQKIRFLNITRRRMVKHRLGNPFILCFVYH